LEEHLGELLYIRSFRDGLVKNYYGGEALRSCSIPSEQCAYLVLLLRA